MDASFFLPTPEELRNWVAFPFFLSSSPITGKRDFYRDRCGSCFTASYGLTMKKMSCSPFITAVIIGAGLLSRLEHTAFIWLAQPDLNGIALGFTNLLHVFVSAMIDFSTLKIKINRLTKEKASRLQSREAFCMSDGTFYCRSSQRRPRAL